MSLLGYPNTIPYTKFDHFDHFTVMLWLLVWKMHLTLWSSPLLTF